VEVRVNGKLQRVDVDTTGTTLKFEAEQKPEVDPNGNLLKAD